MTRTHRTTQPDRRIGVNAINADAVILLGGDDAEDVGSVFVAFTFGEEGIVIAIDEIAPGDDVAVVNIGVIGGESGVNDAH